jgi:hypothetical protein
LQAATAAPGNALESDVRGSLEQVVGSELSNVRVHTDARADSLARSFDATAFTTGSDIFFRSGMYSPKSPEGLNLLAHEAAHTVQQAAGPVAGTTQTNGISLSDPMDQHERAADQTAARALVGFGGSFGDAPVAAAAAAPQPVSAGTGPAAGVTIQRKVSDDLNEMADAGGANAAAAEAEEQKMNKQPPVQKISNINDVKSAQVMVGRLEEWRGPMQEGAGAGGAFTVSPDRVTPDKMAANEIAVSRLNDYLITAGEQSRTLGSFQEAMQKARIDYERLNAQVTHLTVTNRIAGGTAGEIGEQAVQAAGFADPTAAQKRMQDIDSDPHSTVGVMHTQVQDAHDKMVELSQQVGDKQSAATQNAYKYQAALNELSGGIPSVNTNPDQAKELQELKDKIETVKKYVGQGLEYAGKAAEAAGLKGADKAVEPLKKVADFLTDQFYEPQLNDINTKITQYNTAHTEHKITATIDNVRAASRAFTQTISDFNDTREKFAHAQDTFRDLLHQFGRTADKAKGGDKYSQIASVLAEVDTYESQLDDTLRLGYQEQTAATEATNARREVTGSPAEGGTPAQPGLPYYEPYKWFHNNGGWSYQCAQHKMDLSSILSWTYGKGSARGPASQGINATMDDAIKQLQQYRTEVDGMRKALAQAMDLRMDNSMPTSAAGPAPAQRSAVQGL